MNELIVGMGEIGNALMQVLSRDDTATMFAFDIKDMKFHSVRRDVKYMYQWKIYYMHVCFPYSDTFEHDVLGYIKRFEPKVVIIHSTVLPGTTAKLQGMAKIPIVFSPVRGVHQSMVDDLRYYTKYISSIRRRCLDSIRKHFFKAGMSVGIYRDPTDLEYAKILCDTTYYHVLLAYNQWTHILAKRHKLDFDELWRFTGEIHTKLGNRPRMFFDDKGIGGHCVIQNTKLLNSLLDDELLNLLLRINDEVVMEGENDKT